MDTRAKETQNMRTSLNWSAVVVVLWGEIRSDDVDNGRPKTVTRFT